jgi:hypothetical protein
MKPVAEKENSQPQRQHGKDHCRHQSENGSDEDVPHRHSHFRHEAEDGHAPDELRQRQRAAFHLHSVHAVTTRISLWQPHSAFFYAPWGERHLTQSLGARNFGLRFQPKAPPSFHP